jgi:hypothetical protein
MGKAVQPSVLEQRIAQMMPQQGIGAAAQAAPQMGGGIQAASPMAGGMPQQAPQGFQTGGRVAIADRVPEDEFRRALGINVQGDSIAPPDTLALAAMRNGLLPGTDTLPERRSPFAMQGRPGIVPGSIDPASRRGVMGALAEDARYLFDEVPGNFARMIEEARQSQTTPMFTPMDPMGTTPGTPGTYIRPTMDYTHSMPQSWDLSVARNAMHSPQNGGVPQVPEEMRDYLASLMSARETLAGMPDEVRRQLGYLGQNREDMEGAAEAAANAEGEIADMQAAQREEVQDFARMLEEQSAVERAMEAAQKSPAELARERRNRALGQLGAVIGGATMQGDIARGLGGVNESIYQMRRDQEQEQRDIELALASAGDARERERRNLLIQQGGRDVAAAIGSMTRAQTLAQNIMRQRSLDANAAAQLMNTLQRSIQMMASAGGGGGAMDYDTLLKTIDTMRELRTALNTERIEQTLSPAESAAMMDRLAQLDDILQQALSDPRLAWQSEGVLPGVSALEAGRRPSGGR